MTQTFRETWNHRQTKKEVQSLVLEFAARDCLPGLESKIVGLQTTVSKYHALVLTATNQNKIVASQLIGDNFSTQKSLFLIMYLWKITKATSHTNLRIVRSQAMQLEPTGRFWRS